MFIILTLSLSAFSLADDNKYESAMKNAISELYSHQTKEDLIAVSAKFERISLAELDQWLPAYYCALSKLWMTHKITDADEIDKILDQAQQNIQPIC